MNSLAKELIVNLSEVRYKIKEFTKKIEVFLMITEEQKFVDFVKNIVLPNPIVFYI